MNKDTGTIVLVQIDRYEDRGMDVFPFGILYVGSALHSAGYNLRLVHCTELDMRSHVESILREKPLFVGFSVMTGPQIVPSVEMSRAIKGASRVPVVWGGPHPSLIPQQCLAEDYIDFVVAGEGEETALELAHALQEGADPGGILGLGYKRNGEAVLNPSRPFIRDLDRYEPNYDLIDVEKHLGRVTTSSGVLDKVVNLKSSRGCPFGCTFCWNQSVHQRRWRARSAESVIKEVSFLKQRYGVNGVKFFDDNFFVDTKRGLQILEGIGIPAQLEIRIDMMTDEVARRLADLSCLKVMIGIESGSDRLLDKMRKGFHLGDIKRGVEAAAKYQVPAIYSTMCGMPGETQAEAQQTIDLVLWVSQTHREAHFTHGKYLPYPGTPMYEEALAEGFKPPTDTQGWGKMDRWIGSQQGELLPWLDEDQVATIRDYFRLVVIDLFRPLVLFRLKHLPRVFLRPERALVGHLVYRLERRERRPWELALMRWYRFLRPQRIARAQASRAPTTA